MNPKKTALESIRELSPYPFELDPPLRTVEDLDRVTEEAAQRLAEIGGSVPDFPDIPRRRADPDEGEIRERCLEHRPSRPAICCQ